MLKTLFAFCRFFLFWILFFFLNRLVFEFYFFRKLEGSTALEIINTFVYSIRIDSSTIGYIAVLPVLAFVIGWLFPKLRLKSIWLKYYIKLCIVIISLLTIIDLNIYQEWGTKLNYRAISYFFESPREAIASSSSSPILLSVFIGTLLVSAGIYFSKIIIRYPPTPVLLSFYIKLPLSILLMAITFLFIRGGLQVSVMNQSMAYFSNKPILNHAALNTEWNLIQNILNNSKVGSNPYLYLPAKKVETIVDSLYYTRPDSTLELLTTPRPNIVILMLEGYSADLIESLGGDKGVAPYFEKYIKQGVFFDHIYAASDRTDKGIIAILSAFPGQAVRSVMKENDKQEKLPALSQVFKEENYHTSFFYGGQSEFMNMKSYVLSHNFDYLADMGSFEKKDMNSKWGAYDEVVLDKQIDYLNHQKQPFFSALMTLTNHEPFELPGTPHFPGKDKGDMFRSTAYYTDSCLHRYLENAKKQSWYKNTLFVLVADHGHYLPRATSESYHPAKYHIPLLFFGEVIKKNFRGKVISKLGNQNDLAATLLAQLNLPHQQFKWSKDLLNPATKEFAFFNWDNGFGFMLPQQSISFDNVGKRIIFQKNPKAGSVLNNKTLLYGKAFMQQVFAEYLNY